MAVYVKSKFLDGEKKKGRAISKEVVVNNNTWELLLNPRIDIYAHVK